MGISKINIVSMREAFRHEAQHFTTWLEANIDALSTRIGLQLNVLEREKAVGSFNVDLFCEDDNGDYVIIENQLERSDYDHLGKLLTYLVNLDAKTAIWVTAEARPEHERVIDWLNESTSADYRFYLIRVEAIRIGDSPYAPLFTVVTGPDEQIREIGETKKDLAERHVLRREFWTQLLESSSRQTRLFSNVSPNMAYWISAGAGRSGLTFVYLIFRDRVAVELYIDTEDYDRNKKIFDRLFEHKAEVEAHFGDNLDWQRLDEKRACRVRKYIYSMGGLSSTENWLEMQTAMIDAMVRLENALRDKIRKL